MSVAVVFWRLNGQEPCPFENSSGNSLCYTSSPELKFFLLLLRFIYTITVTQTRWEGSPLTVERLVSWGRSRGADSQPAHTWEDSTVHVQIKWVAGVFKMAVEMLVLLMVDYSLFCMVGSVNFSGPLQTSGIIHPSVLDHLPILLVYIFSSLSL